MIHKVHFRFYEELNDFRPESKKKKRFEHFYINLRSSATYAEKLGHIKYSRLIQVCFYNLNNLVKEFNAEIYQYVGDETILTWKINNKFENIRVVEFFFAFQNLIQSKKNHYLENFGIMAEFKAGINYGLVTVAEVGQIKREIAFHGDVLNTAARVQSMCNSLGSKLLITGAFKNLFH